MGARQTTKDVYGPGTYTDKTFVPVPEDCRRLLKYFATVTPGFTDSDHILAEVDFHGGELPVIPGPLKSQVMSAVVHAMMGIVGKEICASKGIETGKVIIDTDRSGLYPATAGLISVDGKGLKEIQKEGILTSVGTDLDKGVLTKNDMRFRSWSIYPTKDPHVWYQVMGNLHPVEFLKVYGLDPETVTSSRKEAYDIIKAEMVKYSAAELDQKNMEHGYCGQTCYTPEQWRNTTMGQRLRQHPLLDYYKVKETPDLPPIPFPQVKTDRRPLAGIKVIELARVIAGPAMGAALAAMGAEVIKIQSSSLPDLQPLSITLTVGKHTCDLDLAKEADREKVHALMQDADVIIQAFRLRSLERKGFGLNDLLAMANKRGKGIVYIDLNCYGPDGYYAERPGFQQIADAASGCSYVCGKAYGFDEGVSVLPSLPIADMLCGAVGALDVMLALRDRAKYGGSYHGTAVLTAVDAIQCEEEIGLYPPDIVKKIQDTYQFPPMTPDLHVEELLTSVATAWAKESDLLTRKGYMVNFDSTAWGKNHSILAPIVEYENSSTSPYWKHGPVPYCEKTEICWSEVEANGY